MNKTAANWKRVLVVLAIAGLLVTVFRYPLLFAFQRLRLSQLACGTEQRLAPDTPIGDLSSCQKLWVHRVNSMERLETVQDYFGGFETDLVFDRAANTCRIVHPPAPAGPLTADVYFRWLQGAPGKKLWLDVKAVDRADVEAIVLYFQQSDSLYAIRDRVIIESSVPALVNRLAAKGFIVSYLVPYEYLDGKIPDTVAGLWPEVRFVSQEDRHIPVLKKLYPGKPIITWALDFDNYFSFSHLQSLLADPSIAVVLINVKSRHYK